MRVRCGLCAAVAVCVSLAAPGARAWEALYSDLPLWSAGDGPVWPEPFADDGGFGCASLVPFGDWRHEEAGDDPQAESWFVLENYGVFHCAYVFGEARDRAGLAGALEAYAFILDLGETETGGGAVRLYALMIGTVGGSRYQLWSAPPAEDAIQEFRVLDPTCPESAMRKGPAFGIWRPDYCVVTSRRMLRRLAVEAAGKPAAGTVRYVGPAAEPAAPDTQ